MLLKGLIRFGRDINQDILNPAVQDPAQIIEGGRVHRFVFPELVDGGAGYVVAVY